MKKRNKSLRIIAAVIAFLLIGIIIYAITEFYGNPFSRKHAEETLRTYASEHHNDLDQFTYDGVAYNFKDGSYHINYTYRPQPYLGFYLSLQENEVYDSYEFDFVEGTNGLAMFASEQYREFGEDVDRRCEARFGICLATMEANNLSEEEYQAFYRNDRIEQLKILTIEGGSVYMNQMDDIETMYHSFDYLMSLFEQHEAQVKDYSLSFYDQSGNQGVNVKHVSKEVLLQSDFKEKLAAALLNPDKYKESDGFYIEYQEVK